MGPRLVARLSFILPVLAFMTPWTASGQQAPAPEPKDDAVAWRDAWPRFRPLEFVATGALLGGTATIYLTQDFKDNASAAENPLDTLVRDGLRFDSREGRDTARYVGDFFFRMGVAYPYLVDTLGVAWIGHGSGDVAGQMFLINTQSFGLTAALSLSTEYFVGRARPSTAPCEQDEDYEQFCDGSDEYGSFISGHTAVAATGAGLTCAHHQNLPLYGGGAGDDIACGVGVAGAVITGLARIANDRHWFSDVMSGWAVGALSGYALPVWLHYGAEESKRKESSRTIQWMPTPMTTGTGVGLGVIGVM